MDRNGYFKGIKLCGKVKVVSSFPDIKVKSEIINLNLI